ncbi:hypothetical protein CPLU01_10910 [Colletotrichum plurivorum]|uniref:Succinyl-CoA synthetase beta chain n=1 Tax=Colletotrichum plurivorum TaxID=2175906 RepID=A0A8H6N9F6_9PEZI|nr:hypothetical protein CPLU01_10910 [Colletotrichum plurivorum]
MASISGLGGFGNGSRLAARCAPVPWWRVQVIRLSVHEYQSHAILKEFDLPVPRAKLARSPAEAAQIVKDLGGSGTNPQNTPTSKLTSQGGKCALKPQILQGGWAEGVFDSGASVQIVDGPRAAEDTAARMLGRHLETGPRVEQLFVAEAVEHDDAWYLAMRFDREQCCPVIVASRRGGVDVTKEQLHTVPFSITHGITPEVIQQVSDHLQASSSDTENLGSILDGLHRVFTAKDATLIEINPLARSPSGSLTCLDTHLTIDDAASRKQKDLFSQRDLSSEVPEEVEAERHGLAYVKMPGAGDVGCVVNGAGLAMATNDAVALHGGSSANFLDGGGQATRETMVKAFEIVLRDERVRAVLVNIYGGITRGDMVAEAIIGAAEELGPLKVPMVVRLQGTNSELGLKMLEEADLGLHTEADFGRAAQKAVELARASRSMDAHSSVSIRV